MSIEFTGGGSDFLEDADGENYVNGLGAFTVSCWVKYSGAISDKGFFTTTAPTGTDNILSMRFDVSGFLSGSVDCLKFGAGISGEINKESASSTATNNLTHLVWTWYSGTIPRMFIDGVEDSVNPSLSASGVTSGSTTVYIGLGTKDTLESEGWSGTVEDFRIYNRSLSDNEIATLYALKGQDNIVNGLLSRWLFNEGSPGSTASGSDVIKDVGNTASNHLTDTGSGSPTYRESSLRIR